MGIRARGAPVLFVALCVGLALAGLGGISAASVASDAYGAPIQGVGPALGTESWEAPAPEQTSIASERSRVEANLRDDEAWGDLGDEYSSVGDSWSAEGCYAVALLLDTDDWEWQGHSPSISRSVDILRQLYVRDDEFIGDLGDSARDSFNDRSAGCALYRLALDLDPGDSEWQSNVRDCGGGTPYSGGTSYGSGLDGQINLVRNNVRDDEEWGDLGDLYQQRGDSSSAEGCYAVALLLDTNDGEWSGHHPMLSRSVDILRQLNIRDDEFIGDLGDSARDSFNDRSAACELYRMALDLDPGDSEWQGKVRDCGGGTPYGGGTSYGSGLDGQINLVRNNVRDDEEWGDLGDLYQQRGDSSSAEGCYAVALLLDTNDGEWSGHHPMLSRSVDILRQLNIRDDEFIGDLGDSASGMGDRSAACSLYRLALDLDPGDSEWQGNVRDCGGGTPYSGGTSYGSGLDGQINLVRSDVRDDEEWGDLGDLYQQRGNSSSAEGCWAVAWLIDTDDFEWQNHHPSLSRSVDILRQLNIRDDEFVGDLGDSARDMGEWSTGCELYRMALDLDPSDPEWQGNVRDCGGGSPYSGGTSYGSGLDGQINVVRSDVRDDEEWGDLGDLYQERGDSSSAEGCYAVARLIDTDDFEWRNHHPSLSRSVDILRQLNIRDDEFIGDLGDSARGMGDRYAAHALYRLALDLDPGDSEWQNKVSETQ